ncbi:hypothetical protein BDV97DRAFT_370061 [Delphinella strobiligena]|nr:hypothetical protein BDV97DRAFT_370061 [Delphinella strobiligena]
MSNNQKVALSFDEMIQRDRKKRKAEELAQQIFGRNRTPNTQNGGNKKTVNKQSPAGGSLASRVGVAKTPSQPRASSLSNNRRQSDNLNANASQNNRNRKRPFRDATRNSPPQSESRARVVQNVAQQFKQQERQRDGQQGAAFNGTEINIRGAAGPYCVVASNFAPGTTAADIESVMAPIGGAMLGCKLISSNPTVIVEMVFTERSGADNVIAMFNNKKADGRILYVYMKEGGPSQPISNQFNSQSAAHSRPSAPVASAPAPAPAAISPRPVQQSSDDIMEVDPDITAANDASYDATANMDGDVNGSAHSQSRPDDATTRAPREPREPYRFGYREDYGRPPRHAGSDVQDGRFASQDQQYPRRGGRYGGGGPYRDDRRGRFNRDGGGRMYSDPMMGRGGNGGFRR